jgi:hypothetical protein
MQIHLLNERFRQQQQILWAGCGAVQVLPPFAPFIVFHRTIHRCAGSHHL